MLCSPSAFILHIMVRREWRFMLNFMTVSCLYWSWIIILHCKMKSCRPETIKKTSTKKKCFYFHKTSVCSAWITVVTGFIWNVWTLKCECSLEEFKEHAYFYLLSPAQRTVITRTAMNNVIVVIMGPSLNISTDITLS